MNRQFTIYCAMLRKDLRLFWMFAALIAGLLLLSKFPDLVAQLGRVAGLMQIALHLGVVLLILVVCYEDAVVSLQHDWLTRPISGPTVLLVKASFVFLAIIVPSVIGVLASSLHQGRSLAESMVNGVSEGADGLILLTVAAVMAFAAVTTGVRQGIIVLLAGMVALMIATLIVVRATAGGEGAGASGSAWVVGSPIVLMTFVVALLVLWVQYRHRHTRAARTIVAVAVLMGMAYPAIMTWPRVSAVQAMLSPDQAAASSVKVEPAPGCFPVQSLNAAGSTAISARFPEEERRLAGADAMVFTTGLIRASVPAGHRLHIGRVAITYRSPHGEVHRLLPAEGPVRWANMESGLLAAEHSWLLSRADYHRFAATEGMETQIDYSLNLLAPTKEARLIADGGRQYYPGIGYCSATFDPGLGRVNVDCYKAGALPAQVVANLEGAPEIAGKASLPNYIPTLLNFWGGRQYTIELPATGKSIPRVIVTAFKARAHFSRQFVLPGVLGGAAVSCPTP
jgi:hypothetical protein